MWFYLLGFFLLIVGFIGSIFSGGIFKILELPVGVVVLAVAFVFAA